MAIALRTVAIARWEDALTLWRAGRRNGALVTHEGDLPIPDEVSWDGWEDQPPRASGASGQPRTRTKQVKVWVSAEELQRMELLASASGESVPSRLRRKGLEG